MSFLCAAGLLSTVAPGPVSWVPEAERWLSQALAVNPVPVGV